MSHEIHLDGGEIALLKTVGLTGTQCLGKNLLEKVEDAIPAELIETIEGLIERGYLLSSRVNVRTVEDVERAFFRVNPVYSRDLRAAVHPSRAREERSGRRQRRR